MTERETGKIRGIVHNTCNLMLGCAKDNIEILINAVEYLKLHQKEVNEEEQL